jgi:hypothetical protein
MRAVLGNKGASAKIPLSSDPLLPSAFQSVQGLLLPQLLRVWWAWALRILCLCEGVS